LAQLLVAAAVRLIVADAAFFDTFASPFSEPAVLTGLLLVAAGVIYPGRRGRAAVSGLALAGAGGFLAIAAKEQYAILAVPAIALAISMTWQTLPRLPRSPRAAPAPADTGGESIVPGQ
jgi:hypothetical protein